jgi:5-methylcytosine-specific restriction endonuclease McrA
MKTCIKCHKNLQLVEFAVRKDSKDGFRNDCKSCQSERDAGNYLTEAREAKRAQQKEYYDANAEAISKQKEVYRKENSGKILARNMKRYCAQLERTPKWLNREQLAEIEGFYSLAKELQWLSEQSLEVDHIIPLQGENVSGLHVPWNLQILTASGNQSKGNRI